MSNFSAQVLLSKYARERCVAKFNELPRIVNEEQLSRAKQVAAVLVPLCVVEGEVSLLYTLRSINLKNHAGQVSFPGGKVDPDETLLQAALRETHEEIGISSDNIEIWGQMPAAIGRNKDILINPIVGRIIDLDLSALKPNADEVDEIFTVPLKSLCDTSTHGHWIYNNQIIPVYNYGKYNVWGITGFITHFFLQCLLPDVYKTDFTRKKFDWNDLNPSKL